MNKTDITRKISDALQGKVGTGVEALLGIIPYAGGTIATILGNYLAEKKIEKITDALESLANKVQVNDTVIDKLLTESQVCELLERHITEVAITSDEEKINYLKNSLNNSFTRADLDFQDKELYLSILKNLTTAEILILKKIYIEQDPFTDTGYPQEPIDYSNGYIQSTLNRLTKRHVVESTSYIEGNQSLENYFERQFEAKWVLLKAGCLQLDSKGLTNIQSNLDNKTRKKVRMKVANSSDSIFTSSAYGSLHEPISLSNKTAYEASKTQFGVAFMDFITK